MTGPCASKKLKVCIIGGGAAGLIAARALFKNHETFGPIRLIERQPRLGGVWLWEEKSKSKLPIGANGRDLNFPTPMYRQLKVNIPKQLMEVRDRPFNSGTPSFPSHHEVRQYLQELQDEAGLGNGGPNADVLTLNSQVESVKRKDDKTGGWTVKWSNVRTAESCEDQFDVLIACNGHYHKENIPQGLKEAIRSSNPLCRVSHSSEFDDAEEFRDGKVLLIGYGASASDIESMLRDVAQSCTIYCRSLFSQDAQSQQNAFYSMLRRLHAKGIADVLTTQPSDFSPYTHVILCTGYEFEFSFLDRNLRFSERGVAGDLYDRIFHIDHPTSLVCLGVPVLVAHIPLWEVQMDYIIAVLSGRVTLPSQDEMNQQCQSLLLEAGNSNPMKLHYLAGKMHLYWASILKKSGLDRMTLAKELKRLRVMKEIWDSHFDCWLESEAGGLGVARSRKFEVDWQTMTWSVRN